MPKRIIHRVKSVSQKADLIETITKATGVFSARFGGAVANFIFTLLLAKYLLPTEVGFIVTSMSLAVIAAMISTLNIDNGAVRHLLHPVEKGELTEAAGFMRFGYKAIAIISPIAIIFFVLFMVLNQIVKDDLSDAEKLGLLFSALTIPILAIVRFESSAAHALSKIISSSLANALFRPIVLCVSIATLALIFSNLTLSNALAATLFACIIAFVVQYFLLRSTFTQFKDVLPDQVKSKVWTSTGLYLSVTILLIDYFQNVVVVSAAIGLQDADVARLAIALRFTGFLRMGLGAVNAAVAPRISKALNGARMKDALELLAHSSHLKFWPTLIVTVVVWFIAPFLVGLFGSEYLSAAWAFRLFALLPLVTAFFGPSIMILNILGHQAAIFRISIVSLALLVLSVPVIGSISGVTGAASAAVLTIFFWEWALYCAVRENTKLDASILAGLGIRKQPLLMGA